MSVLRRFMSKVEVTSSGCWLWQGYVNRDGYGSFNLRGEMRLAHRVAYELFVAEPLPGLTIDHLCRNRACVRPDHLELVTHAENMRRSGPAQATHCKHGHPFDAENTYIRPTGRRDCRRCISERQRRYQARRRAA